MTRTRRFIAIFLAIILLGSSTALACGPFTLEAVFVYTVHPAYPLEQFASGRLGVVQPSYARSYLYTAYRYLSGGSFTPAEQKAMVSLWKDRLEFRYEGDSDGTATWLAARKKVPGVAALETIEVFRAREKPNEYESYINCNNDAFETAAATLNQRIAKYGADSPAMQSWVQAQDQVFANCSSGKSIPAPEQASTDALLRADRAYQIAAANFYAADFDEARKAFETIAADSASPWQHTAPYLVARALIRKGSLGAPEQKQDSLSAAESQLAKILADKKSADLHPAATRLVNLVRLRLHPTERLHELARILLAKNQNDNLKQDLWDYTTLLDQYLEGDDKTTNREPVKGDDLSDWIMTFQSEYAATFDHSFERWQTTRSQPWLIAALTQADAKHAKAGELIAEALKVNANAPAFASARFHAARLLIESGKNDEARTLLDQLLKNNRAQFDTSSLNLLTSKRMLLATTLQDFLAYAPRVPATLSWNDDGREIPVDDDEIEAEMKALKDQPRFDYDAGVAFNKQMPLAVLKEAARNTSLPVPLRRDVAQAVWLRAVILGDTGTADELVPVLRELIPELSTLLDAYTSATTPQAKKFSALYAWLKTPGLEPVVDIGVGRRTPLQQQDSYRDNWWCGNAYQVPEGEQENEVTGPPSFTAATDAQTLLFLSPTEMATAKREWATLQALGAAPNYIAREVIQFANRNPGDQRVPEALHLAVTTTRYGCTDKDSGRWSKSAFDLLHRRYANTTWAKKTPYWFNN